MFGIREAGVRIKERNRMEIEAKLGTMGDYVKIDYLQRALNSGLDFETRKFVLLKLAGMYESRGLFNEAGKLMKGAAEINTTFKDKMKDYMKSVEMYIKGGAFQEGELVFGQTLGLATDREKPGLKSQLKQIYFAQAKAYSSKDKRAYAKKAYERLLTFDLNADEKKQVQDALMGLYDRLGNVKDYIKLRDSSN